MDAKIIHLDEVDSTNRFLRDYQPAEGEQTTVCTTLYQTAGRGCGKNTWESERGQNLLFSLLIHPTGLPASRQFFISMATALAISDTLCDMGLQDISVKWPNDIYWRDRKLCGILIEHSLAGNLIRRSIIGIGLNVNQRRFLSDAPNPVSLRQILGHDTDSMPLLNDILRHMDFAAENFDHTLQRYNSRLYRRDHLPHLFRDQQGTFQAEIVEVAPDGTLWLRRHDDCRLAAYAFKEIEYIITEQP